ncbi:MAG TPA: hypothetical protein VGE36_13565 [Roseateles sp.]|jgi:hypothetical protein
MSAARFILALLVLSLSAAPVVAYFAWLGPLLVGSGHRDQAAMCCVGSVVSAFLVLRWLPVRGSRS